jgi:hypothetical protein
MNETDAAPVPRICWEVDMARDPSTAIHWREDITPGRTPVATLYDRQIVETTNKGGLPRGSTAAARSNDLGRRLVPCLKEHPIPAPGSPGRSPQLVARAS